MLADRPGTGAQDHTDLMISFTLCDPGQNLRSLLLFVFCQGHSQQQMDAAVISFCA
jgi:hypothetical protein